MILRGSQSCSPLRRKCDGYTCTAFRIIVAPLAELLAIRAAGLEFDETESEAAQEGTAAHALCEHKLKEALGRQSARPTSRFDSNEMEMYTDDYVAFVLERLAEAQQCCKDPVVLIEQRLDFSCYVPDGFGTGDCIIAGDGVLSIIDFKYGASVLVDAYDNPQMKLYALGALRLFEQLYDIHEVAMTIYQPRRENVSTWTITVDELCAWATRMYGRR